MKKIKKLIVIALTTAMLLGTTITTNAAVQSNINSNSAIQTHSAVNARIVPGERFHYIEPGHIDLEIGQERLLTIDGGLWYCKVISFEHKFTTKRITEGYYQAVRKYIRY